MNIFEPIDSIFVKRLTRRLSEERQIMLEGLLHRLSRDDYQYKVGQIKAFSDVLDIIDDVHKDLQSPEK